MATSQSLKRGFHRLTVFLVTALLIPAVTALEGSAGQSPTCVEEALNAYTQATLALSQRQDLMSLYSDLRRRRLEEKYCLRIARCMDDDRLAVVAKFSSCLREETLEYYDAVPQ